MNPLLLLAVAWAALLAAAPLLARLACRLLGLVKPNFRGERIPAAVGITFLIVAAATYGLLSRSRGYLADVAPLFLLVSVGFGLLGLIDDGWGSRDVGGFRGHVGALLRGRPTTGGVKLLGGGALALVAGWLLHGGPGIAMLLDAGLIALAANTLNLLDVRPGRALFGFALLALPTLLVVAVTGSLLGGLLLGAVAAAAALEAVRDARGRAMMGDTGSNLLGATAGLAAAVELPIWARVVALLVLLALNLAAERVSLSKVIERTPWLAAIDRRLGVR